jgi:hypothetical protein
MGEDNIYLSLTREFNAGRLRSIISSGQAVVLHHLAVMSKDGDWILRGDAESLSHVLRVLAGHGAHYRFGAPLDARWMDAGWSSHFEFPQERLRVRADFVVRPQRLCAADLDEIWREAEGREIPFVGLQYLAEIKKTNREKDYAVIGELARQMPDAADQFLYSRSAQDLTRLASQYPDMARELSARRPLLGATAGGIEKLEEALDRERRELIHAHERRLRAYLTAAKPWGDCWPGVAREITERPLLEAHEVLVRRAEGVLPFRVPGGLPDE